jgi:hypothetical protein
LRAGGRSALAVPLRAACWAPLHLSRQYVFRRRTSARVVRPADLLHW